MEQLTFNVVDDNGVWKSIEQEFLGRLPLRNLIWKGGLTQSARFIEQLDIKVTVGEQTADRTSGSHDSLVGCSGRLLNIYLLESDSDIDTYKAVIKARVKAWVGRVSQRKGEGWMVVYAASEEEVQRMSNNKFLSMRTTVFDRLKSDFQGKKDSGEHVVLLQASAVESWNKVFLAMRSHVVSVLEERVLGLADDVRRMDANRMLPGWNYCKFFVVKEGVVRLYRLMGLADEALAQYDELEAVFLQLLGAQRLSWFSAFGGAAFGDDYSDVLDTDKRDYGRRLVDTTISLFDLRMYLFGRQAQLLVALGQYVELAERAQRFMASFGQAMQEKGTGLSSQFVAAWIFSTSMNVAEILEGAPSLSVRADGGASARALATAKAGLLAGARRQLDALGDNVTGLDNVANPVLAAALASESRFDQIYIRTCEQAAQYYGESGRRRFARAMQGDVARLLASRKQWDGAARLLRTLVPGKDEPLGAMNVAALEQLAECEQRLGNAPASLECVVRLIAQPSSARSDYAARLGSLCSALGGQQQSQRVAGDLFAAVGVSAVDHADSLCITLVIRSRVAVTADRVAAVLACGGSSSSSLEIEFVARGISLCCGESAVQLTADSASCAGRFTVAAVCVAIGGAEFAAGAADPLVVALAEHPTNPVVRLGPALAADAGRPALHVAVHTQAAGVSAGMTIRLFDARAGALLAVTGSSQPGVAADADGVLVVSDAIGAGCVVEADVELGAGLLPASVSVCAFFKTLAGDCRVFVGAARIEPGPSLAVSAQAFALREGHSAVVLRAQCTAASLRLASLRASHGQAEWTLAPRTMRRGDVATAICEVAADSPGELLLRGEARFATPGDSNAPLRSLRFGAVAPLAQTVAVHVTTGSRFCRVLEPTPLCVRLRIVGATAARRLCVAVAERSGSACWLVAGPIQCEVEAGADDVCLEYALVALAPGFLRLPDVVCVDADREKPRHLLHTLVDADYPTLCAVPSHSAFSVYSVPVVVRA
ncbi:hypothetical protein GGI20_001665 [Coemansia sp. BCRC 34301]|nr:hypothetical protein GGI20_001665 [Coemansia sp. BCRC 34301]